MSQPEVIRAEERYGLLAALLLSAASFPLLFGFERALGRGGPFDWPMDDLAQHIAGAYAYLDGAWTFPLFHTDRINAPEGANIIFTDSAPLAGLLAKILHSLTGLRFNYLGAWFAVLWVGQGFAGALLLRELGARRAIPIALGALWALAVPTFLWRYGHLALSSHFLILLALALYVRGTGTRAASTGYRLGWLTLCITALFTHIYLLVMVFGILAAAGADRVWRRHAPFFLELAFLAAAAVLVLFLAYVGGYFSVDRIAAEGFGTYSMNLLAPFWPVQSLFFGGVSPETTGGEYEGFNYLGLAGLAVIAAASVLAARRLTAILLGHPALTAFMVASTLYAIGTQVWLGEHRLLDLSRFDLEAFSIFRASGRFFWPVAYLLLFASLACLARHFRARPAAGAAALCLLVAVQVAESYPLVQKVVIGVRDSPQPLLLAAVERADSIHVFPGYECLASDDPRRDEVGQIVWMAAKAGKVVDTAYLAREQGPEGCRPVAETAPGELTIAVEPSKVPGPCFDTEQASICGETARRIADHLDLPQHCRAGSCPARIDFSETSPAVETAGLSGIEPWGRWTDGKTATVSWNLPSALAEGRYVLELDARAFQATGEQQSAVITVGEQTRRFAFPADGRTTSVWMPVTIDGQEILEIELEIDDPISPREVSGRADDRQLGLGLVSAALKRIPDAS